MNTTWLSNCRSGVRGKFTIPTNRISDSEETNTRIDSAVDIAIKLMKSIRVIPRTTLNKMLIPIILTSRSWKSVRGITRSETMVVRNV